MPNFKKNPGGMKPSGFKMKNSMLRMSAKMKTPMHANYGSPMDKALVEASPAKKYKSAPMKQDKNKTTVGQRVKEKVEKRTVDSKKLDNLTFSQAFRKARNAGVKRFTWKGKNYTTEVAKQRLAVLTKAKLKKKSRTITSEIKDK